MIVDACKRMTRAFFRFEVPLEIHLPEFIGRSAFKTLKIALWSLDRKQLDHINGGGLSYDVCPGQWASNFCPTRFFC